MKVIFLPKITLVVSKVAAASSVSGNIYGTSGPAFGETS